LSCRRPLQSPSRRFLASEFERNAAVGGKSFTVFEQRLGHELGTCYVALGYRVVKRSMAAAGIGEFILKSQKILPAEGPLVDFAAFVEKPAGLPGTAEQSARYFADWLRSQDWDLRGGADATQWDARSQMREEVSEPFGTWLEAR
jgi:hypothetical protein